MCFEDTCKYSYLCDLFIYVIGYIDLLGKICVSVHGHTQIVCQLCIFYFILSGLAEARSNGLSNVVTVVNGRASVVLPPWQLVEMQCAFLNWHKFLHLSCTMGA